MDLCIGADLGSTAIKVVITCDKEILWRGVTPALPPQERETQKLIDSGLADLAARGINTHSYLTVSTGYGKKLFGAAKKNIDELSANALGLFSLSGGTARRGINVGGQDLKILRISRTGAVLDFKMNDKCAAGTGRFFEQAARILDVPLGDFTALAENAASEIEINSTCVVFAESEIVSLLAEGIRKEDIARALIFSVARRIAGFIGENEDLSGIYLDGGPAKNHALASALEAELGAPVYTLDEPQYTVAYGAALSVYGLILKSI
jgi:predicted CoA-substrate-specific enzyme activase